MSSATIESCAPTELRFKSFAFNKLLRYPCTTMFSISAAGSFSFSLANACGAILNVLSTAVATSVNDEVFNMIFPKFMFNLKFLI